MHTPGTDVSKTFFIETGNNCKYITAVKGTSGNTVKPV